MKRQCTPLALLLVLVSLLLVAGCRGAKPRLEPTKTLRPVFTEVPPATETNTPEPTATPTNTPEPTPTLDPNINPLTGLGVSDPASLRHRVILVRYGHDRIARPPSGMGSAEVVFEEIAEGGFITRLTAAFLQNLPEVVGPIRSARPAVIEMMQQLQAALVYAGASHGTTLLLDQQPFPMYSHVTKGADMFFRSSAKPSPHNLYMKLPAARQRLISDGQDQAADLRGWTFSPAAPAGSPAQRIEIPYPWMAATAYTYDVASGTYLRFVEGVPHTDALTGEQIAPANVIVLYAEHSDSDIVEDSLGNLALLIKWTGQGRVQIFRDGVLVEGTWQREQPNDLTRFKDASGKDIPLKPGQSWVEVVPTDYQLKIQ